MTRPADGELLAGPAPEHAVTARPGVGFVSLAATRYAFSQDGSMDLGQAYPSVLNHRIEAGWELRYVVLPEWYSSRDDGFAADAVAVDLVFTDGSRLHDWSPRDQHGIALEPAAQHAGKILQPDQWNLIRVSLDAVVGHTVAAVELRFADVRGEESLDPVHGWIDALEIIEVVAEPERPTERARTRQGSMSSSVLSRGNCVPAVAVPNGFVRGIPVTRADSMSWPYSWHSDNRDDNRPAIQAFATSHLPSPWMGERGAFQIMPGLANGAVAATPIDRALGFSHREETAYPHLYKVELDGGIRGEMTAADHTIVMRFSFPEGACEGVLVFDQIEGSGTLVLPDPDLRRPDSVVTAYTDDGGAGRPDRRPSPRAYLHAHIDRPVSGAEIVPRVGTSSSGSARGWVRVLLGADRTVVVRMATSFIGTAQAARNLVLDGAAASFDTVSERAGTAWDEWIGRVSLDDATAEQRAMMATALYRVGLFPSRAHENLGSRDEPRPAYASPFHPMAPSSPTRTGARIVAGELSVDHGFWDVYRTVWPLYALIDPERAARLLDGFVEHYRCSGWTSRWSAPGPIDSMTGTASDITFAHAVALGVPVRTGAPTGPADRRLDLWGAYLSALRNATVPSPDPKVGRKGLATSAFRGWVDTDVTEGLSWTLDGAINDLAVAVLAQELRERIEPSDPRQAELQTSVEYFTARAGSHATVFEPRTGFYLGRRADGSFRLGPGEYDPTTWGHDYAETTGWGTAFSAPHDGAGMAALHGGERSLARKIEALLGTPERGDDSVRGSYLGVIHEMLEARNQRFGQLALSNQPAHHIPFIPLFAARPDLAQDTVRTALERLFTGGEIGQGWPGDEDNGEMSAWWIFAVLGLYPLVPGSPGYVIVAPFVPRARVRVGTEAWLTIDAPGADRAYRYVQSVRIDGREWPSTYLPHQEIVHGATLSFVLADTPQRWGTAPSAQPPSLTSPGRRPSVLRDLSAEAQVHASAGPASAVFDDDATSPGLRCATGDVVTWEFDGPRAPDFLTVTAELPGRYAFGLEYWDGGSWVPHGSWVGDFAWERQTVPFLLESRRSRMWRWVAGTEVTLTQLELLVREERA